MQTPNVGAWRLTFARLRCSGAWLGLLFVFPVTLATAQEPGSPAALEESLANWAFYTDVTLPDETDGEMVDFILPPAVYEKSRVDLQDLRLYGADGTEIPFALRVRKEKFEKQSFEARVFNRTQVGDDAAELTLELERGGLEHNELEIEVPGVNYRRRVELEGSDDLETWRPVHEQFLIDFTRGDESLRDATISYPASRYRYLRVRVFRDPQVDKQAVKIGKVSVVRRVSIPGETLMLKAELGARQPVRTDHGPGSAWIATLGGEQTPVDHVEVTIADSEFARDYQVEVGEPPGVRDPFRWVASGVWQRRAGGTVVPMESSFSETRAARLRIEVTDNRNPQLALREVRYSAPARQIVFNKPAEGQSLRLYFGNADAERTQYDFARNLPERIDPAPARAELGLRLDNPVFVPEPLPFTERWPWLIYVVLSAVIVVLSGVLISLARAAIAAVDAADTSASASATIS